MSKPSRRPSQFMSAWHSSGMSSSLTSALMAGQPGRPMMSNQSSHPLVLQSLIVALVFHFLVRQAIPQSPAHAHWRRHLNGNFELRRLAGRQAAEHLLRQLLRHESPGMNHDGIGYQRGWSGVEGNSDILRREM